MENFTEALRTKVWGRHYKSLLFPLRLHILLDYEEFSSDLWWVDTNTFAVNREAYKKDIMNVLFNEHKFSSFQKLLHKYGFRRIGSFLDTTTNSICPADIILFQHDLFIKGERELTQKIIRRPTSPSTTKSTNEKKRCRTEESSVDTKSSHSFPSNSTLNDEESSMGPLFSMAPSMTEVDIDIETMSFSSMEDFEV